MNDEDKTHEDWMREASEEADRISDAHGNDPMEFMALVIFVLLLATIVVAIIGKFIA